MELIDLTELQQVLQDLANDIRDNYKEHLQFNDRYTERGVPTGYSEKLIDSVKTQVVVGDNAYEVTMTLNDYWKYVEYDTKPHFPPLNKILQKFFSRTDLKDVTYEVIEISSGSLKYQLDFNANWK